MDDAVVVAVAVPGHVRQSAYHPGPAGSWASGDLVEDIVPRVELDACAMLVCLDQPILPASLRVRVIEALMVLALPGPLISAGRGFHRRHGQRSGPIVHRNFRTFCCCAHNGCLHAGGILPIRVLAVPVAFNAVALAGLRAVSGVNLHGRAVSLVPVVALVL
eukprot:1294795-Amphidinium_carterae.4